MTGVLQDLRYAMRQLRQNLGFAWTSILILSLGICASVAIFGFVDAALIKPLPYPNPDRLVEVTESAPMFPRGADLSYPDYVDWKKDNRVFSSMEVYNDSGYLLRTPLGAEPVSAVRVSDGFLRTLKITPADWARFLFRRGSTASAQDCDPELCRLAKAVWRTQRRQSAKPSL